MGKRTYTYRRDLLSSAEVIPNFPSYGISRCGTIIRVVDSPRGPWKAGMVVKPNNSSNGYPYVKLCHGGKYGMLMVHRLMAQMFLPQPRPDQNQVNHLNGIRDDYRLENLEWCNQSENMLHSYTNLTDRIWVRGEVSTLSKLTDEKVFRIRELWDNGFSIKIIHAMYPEVGANHIRRIANRTRWNHV